jgi:hypothetical protein
VASLDQLYIQGALLRETLLSKLTSLVPPRCAVHPSDLKPPARALEKLLHVHGGDASRLLDISRHTLVCEAPADLLRCLRALADDPEVRVLAVRNSLDPALDSAWSAGFRCVRVSLALGTPAAAELGAAGHVCEVLLVLQAFAQLAGDAQHARYLVHRNCRRSRRPWAAAAERLRDALRGLRDAGARALTLGRACKPLSVGGGALHAAGGRAEVAGCLDGLTWLLRRLSLLAPPRGRTARAVVSAPPPASSVPGEELGRVLRLQLVAMAKGAGPGVGAGRMSDMGHSFAQAADGSVLNTRCPVAASLCKRWFQALLVVLAIISLAALVAALDTIARNGAVVGRRFNFTNLMARGQLGSGQGLTASGPGIEGFGLLLDGCPASFARVPSNATLDGRSLMLEFADAVTMWVVRLQLHAFPGQCRVSMPRRQHHTLMPPLHVAGTAGGSRRGMDRHRTMLW